MSGARLAALSPQGGKDSDWTINNQTVSSMIKNHESTNPDPLSPSGVLFP